MSVLKKMKFFCVVFLGFAVWAAASTTKQPNNPWLAPADYINPHTYLYGFVQDAFLISPDKSKRFWTVVNVNPFLSPLLYHETYLFCGNQLEKLKGTEDQLVVVVYSRAVPETAKLNSPPQITACHALDYVRVIPAEPIH